MRWQLSLMWLSLWALAVEGIAPSQAREPWTSSQVHGSPEPPPPFAVQRVYPHLQFNQPVELLPLGPSGRMLVLEVGGRILTFEDREDCRQADVALDLAPRVPQFSRALGIGVHPNFPNDNSIFVCYAANPVASPQGTRLSRFRMTSANPPRIDPESEEVLLTWASGGHNGCAIRFDARGLLYFSAGDGARPYPPDEYDVSQDLSDLRATICRIDVNQRSPSLPYAIPADNPFVNTPGARPEIWAYGFRNPWRFTIDHPSGKLFCGDVGWELWELVHDVQRGGNHGWSIFEGPQPIRSDLTPGPTPIIAPLIAYPHTVGLSVTGGVVYRGQQLPELEGAFLYGDYVTGLLWGVRPASLSNSTTTTDQARATSPAAQWNELLAETGLKIITMTTARDGEVLVMSYDGGIYRLQRNERYGQTSEFPKLLSQTGLFSDTPNLVPAPGVLAYQLTTTASQPGSEFQFVLGVPGSETISLQRQQRNWKYPIGTVFAKSISLPSVAGAPPRKIETQLLHFDGIAWQPYTYAWKPDQSDAELVPPAGQAIPLTGFDSGQGVDQLTEWRYHSRSECRACHSNQAGGAVGFTLANLSNLAGQPVEDPVAALQATGLIGPPPANLGSFARMVSVQDTQADLETRARAYLAVNCAHCHCRGGGGTVALDLSYHLPTSEIFAVDFPATQGTFEIPEARVIAPGAPAQSVLFYRLATSGLGHMPKLWARDTDSAGLLLVHDWIKSLPTTITVKPSTAGAVEETEVIRALQGVHELEMIADQATRQARAQQELLRAGPLTRGLWERFVPAAQRVQRLGNDVDVAYFLAAQGDAQRGRERFFNSPTWQCRNCHRLAQQGQAVGPDLDGIGKLRSRAELLESLLEPSQKIEPAFTSLAVVTVDGRVVLGLKVAQSEQQVTLRTADGRDVIIANDDIEHMTPQSQSLMPMGLVAEMTAEELSDLLELLTSLR